MATQKRAQDVRVGDAIVFLGRAHRVDALERYRGPFEPEVFRTARSDDGWGMTLFYDEVVEVSEAVTSRG